MDLETAQTTTTAKLPILKQGEYDMWRLMIEQYFQVQDYALWDKTMLYGIFDGNEATKKTQKTLLKQMYENFSAPSTESLDFIFNRLQKIISQLAILGENISQEDLNLKFLRSLPSEWNTHVVVWRNKPDLDTMSFDNLYKILRLLNKRLKEMQAQAQAQFLRICLLCHPLAVLMKLILLMELVLLTLKLALLALKLALLVLKRDGFEVAVSIAEHEDKKAFLFPKMVGKDLYPWSDKTGYEQVKVTQKLACLKLSLENAQGQEKESNQLKLKKFDKASKSIRQITGIVTDKSRKGVGFISYNDVSPSLTGLFSPPKFDLSNSSLEEFQQPEFEGYRPKTSKSVSEDISNKVRETPDAPLLKELVSDDNQDKYVDENLKKFGFLTVNTASTPMETSKPLLKDAEAEDVDVHIYRSMTGSLMYLTSSRPYIIFVICACARFQDSPFDLEAYSDSDYDGASLDRKSTIGVLWIQNQMLDYGYNFMNTKIFIDNESTICIVKNPVFHSKTKHIEIRHHFIRDSNEKKLIQMIKIHTDQNVADLLTKAFDVGRFQYLIASIGMLNL
ncbi:hypothetical protein Tco_0295180 [Tanacetum coccineum]